MPEKKPPEHWIMDVLALILTLTGLALINALTLSFGLAFALSYSLNRVFFTSLMRYSRWAVLAAVAVLIIALAWQGEHTRRLDLELTRTDWEIADLQQYYLCRANNHSVECQIATLNARKAGLRLCDVSRGEECP